MTSLTATSGAMEIGTLVATFLFGLVTAQVYVYFHQCSNDPWGLKFLVGLVWSLDLGHTVAISKAIYAITITRYGRPDLIGVLPHSLDVSIIIRMVCVSAYKFSKTLRLPILCISLSLIRLAGSLGLSVIAFRRLPLPEFEARVGWLITAILVVGLTVDLILTVTLCYYLRYWRNGGFGRYS
ncbi:hypothetical protein B0H17DRAFT_962830 [Mycena rosella]|uniref:Uncharacterized protein n=1 Tax=Mycena rosella TaxID=1033263 RepID=A0AAD7BSU7_MYCRO|nr:hypothetical protein B0H17DRAFT_962830 [Mycena rosella]